jgi:hypothetical protein
VTVAPGGRTTNDRYAQRRHAWPCLGQQRCGRPEREKLKMKVPDGACWRAAGDRLLRCWLNSRTTTVRGADRRVAGVQGFRAPPVRRLKWFSSANIQRN